MQTYHFDEIIVNDDGVVTIEGLPPTAKVAVMVITSESFDWHETMRAWMTEMKKHPFSQMSKKEILDQLRQSREKIYEEDYGHRHAD